REFANGNYTLLILHGQSSAAEAKPSRDSAVTQGSFSRHEAALDAQAQRTDAGGALLALHLAQSAPGSLGVVLEHDRERQAHPVRGAARAPRRGVPAPARLVHGRERGPGAPAARSRGRRRSRSARARVPILPEPAPGGDPGAPRSDRDQRAAVRE